MQSTSHIAEALKTLMTGDPFSADVAVTSRDIDEIIRSGLGPIFYHVLKCSNRVTDIDTDMKLKASDITSRIMSAEQFDNVETVIGILQSAGIEPVLLKGTSFATRYYPEPHLRVMGDIDVLVPPSRVGEAQGILVREGFEKLDPAQGMDYETHIHSAPLFHPKRNLWVELHRSLLPGSFAASNEAPLDLSGIECQTEPGHLGALGVKQFRTEFELVYLAAGWCFDLTHGFGSAGLQRSLFDCTLMLKTDGARLNWDDILRWSNDTLLGTCVYILLSFLRRTGVFVDADNFCEILGRRQNHVNAVSLRLIHSRIERYLVRFGSYGRLSSPSTMSNMFDALIRKSDAWTNLAAVPGNILFPRRESRRFELAYQIGRLHRLLSRRQ